MSKFVEDAIKAIQWERAKGELRAFAAIRGSDLATEPNFSIYVRVDDAIEKFIKDFESQQLHD